MEIQSEIVKTQNRIGLLEHQNDKFKALLEKALTVTRKTSSKSTGFESEFRQESIRIIEQERENLKDDLSQWGLEDEKSLVDKVESLERLRKAQQEQIERLQVEHAEIKFLLLHPESRNSEWLRNILELENDVTESQTQSLVEERFRLQRKILNLEKKKAELLLAINDAAIPQQIGSFIKQDLEKSLSIQGMEYEDLRFRMLTLEDERSRLLNDLQCVLDQSRKEIAKEYNHLQKKIMEVERQKANLKMRPTEPGEQKITRRELESIFNAFTNIPLKMADERARIERIKSEVGTMFSPGLGLPLYCNIL